MSIITYLTETRAELRQVKWLSRPALILYTLLVIVCSVALSLYLGLADVIFSRGLQFLFSLQS